MTTLPQVNLADAFRATVPQLQRLLAAECDGLSVAKRAGNWPGVQAHKHAINVLVGVIDRRVRLPRRKFVESRQIELFPEVRS